MSGDWMKIELELPDKPEVFRIAGILCLDPDSVVGKLVRVWAWFDKHTEGGNAASVTYALVDRISGVTGFAEAMSICGWLVQDGCNLVIPNFEYHNGKTAKNRALTAKRVAGHKSKSNAKGNGDSVTSSVTSALPREEKRREEEKQKQAPAGVDEFFPGIDARLVSDFKAVRRAKKAALTQTAVDGIKREAEKAGLGLDAVLKLCCERGWSSFKAEWLKGDGQPLGAADWKGAHVSTPGGGRRELP